jgi:uncharacterized oxidoreductase
LRLIGRHRFGDREDGAEPGDGAVVASEVQTRGDAGTPVGVVSEAKGDEIGRRGGEPDPRLAARFAELTVAHGELEPAFVDDADSTGKAVCSFFTQAQPRHRRSAAMKLEGKKVLITGGASGIGLELAHRLADANDVVIVSRSNDRLDIAREADPRLCPVQLDVTSHANAEAVIDWLGSEFGGLDLLITSAGIMRADPGPGTVDPARDQVAVNLVGAIRMTHLALPILREAREAAVVFLSSGVALAAVPGFSVYAATKAGVHSFARSLRAGLAGTPIRVFEVLPPVVDTELTRGLDVPKITPAAVADAVIAGLRRDKQQIAVAQVRPVVTLARFAPRLADRLVRRALRPSIEAAVPGPRPGLGRKQPADHT